jgi:hypothetical protein
VSVPPRPFPAKILVAEREPFWLPELERRFPDHRVRPFEDPDRASSPDEEWLPECDRLIVVTGERLIPRLTDWRPRLAMAAIRGVPVLALLRRGELAWEWPLRELGVTAVLEEFIGGHRLADACERLLAGASPGWNRTP